MWFAGTGHERDLHFTVWESMRVWFHRLVCIGEKKKKPRPQAVWSFGILRQAVRWHSLHIRNSHFLSNLCGERTESAGLQALISPTLHSRLNVDQRRPWLDHKGGGIAVVRGKHQQLAGKWKVNAQLTRLCGWFLLQERLGRWESSSSLGLQEFFCGLQQSHCLHPLQRQS